MYFMCYWEKLLYITASSNLFGSAERGYSNYSSAECSVWDVQLYRHHQSCNSHVQQLHNCIWYLHINLHILYFACRDFWQIKKTLQNVYLFPMSQIFQKNKSVHPLLSSLTRRRKTSIFLQQLLHLLFTVKLGHSKAPLLVHNTSSSRQSQHIKVKTVM